MLMSVRILFRVLFSSHRRALHWGTSSFPRDTMNSFRVMKSTFLSQISFLGGRRVKHHRAQRETKGEKSVDGLRRVTTLDWAGLKLDVSNMFYDKNSSCWSQIELDLCYLQPNTWLTDSGIFLSTFYCHQSRVPFLVHFSVLSVLGE